MLKQIRGQNCQPGIPKKAGQKKKKYLPTSNEEQPKDSVSSFDMFHKNQNKSKNASNRGSIYITYN